MPKAECLKCAWHGIRRLAVLGWPCPRCQGRVTRARTAEDLRCAKAKAELTELQAYSDLPQAVNR